MEGRVSACTNFYLTALSSDGGSFRWTSGEAGSEPGVGGGGGGVRGGEGRELRKCTL